MKINFTKMHGIGNDFMVIDTFSQAFEPDAETIRRLADRNFGIGFDQLLLLEPSTDSDIDVRYRIFNSDGGEVMQCGNGARCAARYLHENALVQKDEVVAETGAGRLTLLCNGEDVTVNMGVPKLSPTDIPAQVEKQGVVYLLRVGEQVLSAGLVNLGNPHAVIIVEDVDNTEVELLGPKVQEMGIFPDGVNVGFMQVLDRQTIHLRVYERGAGETLACGSGACAAVVSGRLQGIFDDTVTVHLRGGQLQVAWAGEGQPVMMTGPAATVYRGIIEL